MGNFVYPETSVPLTSANADSPHYDLAVIRYGIAEIVGRLAARVDVPMKGDEIAALCRDLDNLGRSE